MIFNFFFLFQISFYLFRDIDNKPVRRSSFSNYAALSLKLACVGAVIAGIVQYTRYRLR